MKNSMAAAYAMKKRKKMAQGGSTGPTIGSIIHYPGADQTAPTTPVKKAHGGEIEEDEDHRMAYGADMVDRIMRKKYSQGGKVANGGMDELDQMADGKPNNFDDLSLRDDLESHSDGANNGDFLGNAQEDQDREDIISRIMRQRSMKQRNPRPA